VEKITKSWDEVFTQLVDIIHRHKRKYIAKNLRPCPLNGAFADVNRAGVKGCRRCDSSNIEVCRAASQFVPLTVKQELVDEFSARIRTLKVLQHEYRDILVLLWMLHATEEPALHAIMDLVEKARTDDIPSHDNR
jgi:hypothetical protein